MSRLLLHFLLTLVRVFYTPIRAVFSGGRPPTGPRIFVANHPNGLLDPVIVRLALGSDVHFLAKSTLFRSAIGRFTLGAFGGIPVYRARDGQNTQDNERTFAACRDVLAAGGSIALFPEGTSHSDPSLKPLKTGAARIALSAVAERGLVSLPIYPTGLTYESKDVFRTGVLATFGEPIDAAVFARQHGTDFAAAEALTEDIHRALSGVLLEADTQELWRGFLAVAAWTDPVCRDDLAARHARARVLRDAFQRLHSQDPAAAETLVERARSLVRAMEQAGVSDPLAIAEPPPIAPLGSVALLLLVWPLAAVGAVLAWAPYRLVRPIALRIAGSDTDLVSTVKLLRGLAVLAATYSLEALVVGVSVGPVAGLATLVLGPALGFVALRYGERLEARQSVLRAHWLRATAAQRRTALLESREALAVAVADALGTTP